MPSICVINFGCAKNLVDGERYLGLITEAGYTPTDSPEGADLCLINTCGFLESAVRENIDAILELEDMVKSGATGEVIVAGCLVNRYGDDLKAELPWVGRFIRAEDMDALALHLKSSSTGCRVPVPGRVGRYRYLKVAEGCNNRCSYCMIPSIRGSLASAPVKAIIDDAHTLLAQGALELCLVAQDLTAYGSDSGGPGLMAMLDALCGEMPPHIWLRLLYLHPERVTPELLEYVAGNAKILSYLDMPVQHASGRILSAMGRGGDMGSMIKTFKIAREIDPDFALRTTIMTGFPGEKDADHREVLRFIEEVQFDRVGAFIFSPEDGAGAALLPGRISPAVAKKRLDQIMHVSEDAALARQERFLGRVMDVLADEIQDGLAYARSFRDAPEVDGVVYVDVTGGDFEPGFMRVRINGVSEHHMEAEIVP